MQKKSFFNVQWSEYFFSVAFYLVFRLKSVVLEQIRFVKNTPKSDYNGKVCLEKGNIDNNIDIVW